MLRVVTYLSTDGDAECAVLGTGDDDARAISLRCRAHASGSLINALNRSVHGCWTDSWGAEDMENLSSVVWRS
jgi:hypothetical protein